MKTSGILAVILPAKGLLVYDSSTNQVKVNVGGPATPNWLPVGGSGSTGSGTAWSLAGNSGISATTQFIGTTDRQTVRFRVNNIRAGELNPVTGTVFWSLRAGNSNTNGFSNVAIGTYALKLNANGSNNLYSPDGLSRPEKTLQWV